MDEVFKALADPRRRELLDRLRRADGLTLGQLCTGLALTRQAVSRHLAQLEAANLIVTVWRGREKLHHLNPVPIGEIYSRWIGRYETHRVAALLDLKAALEERPMSETGESFAYSIFIDAAPERIFQALTDGAFTRQYWAGRRIASDWTVGSPVHFYIEDSEDFDISGTVLDYAPPTRLSYSWRKPAEPEAAASTVVFELLPFGGSVQLKITHAPLPSDSTARTGWVAILSSLKSLLEAGKPLAATALFRKPCA
ncbi:ArsR/SmtB family transcription factor [Labrys wisconsinensis]|uniref:Uncharacterized protein YndB with AHSA1/START domain/DNA-binding transcriptional ArsR family regulator n=1 Tax=Labrys wisconsinensis TaxID=425677 RepID=A0ABU0J850_9HYPH|nr:metalloregulator ArsR/SmtB family transcription factor [Labrys wisconsinensis]MDQ0469439.1 uncharacterized protein YndB with AHSA1/START domain/DNA-binding transcriptional ArsR family regulator [Labrys wisconsinensis]